MSLINISQYQLDHFETQVASDPQHSLIQNMLANNPLSKVNINRRTYQSYEHFYNVTTPAVKVTDQKSSGRCWLFAGLNVIRREMIKKYHLDSFEFSQSYLFFWDKLERLNYGLDAIIKTRDLELDSREVQHLLHDPTCDGGQWDMFCNLVEKYGLVPKSVYRETHHSSNSTALNNVLKRKFREYAMLLRQHTNIETLHEQKQRYLLEIYRILTRFLGTPPKTFTWNYVQKEKDQAPKPTTLKNVSPLEFYRHHVNWKSEDYICLVNDPRNTYGQLYTVQFLGNVVEGKMVKYLNVPIEKLRKYTLESLKQEKVVWFGCDVMQNFQGDECAMDLELVDNSSLFQTTYGQTKRERLQYAESLMTHAMVFTGARTELVNDNVEERHDQEVASNWQVENSWADKGPSKGFYNMSDAWFGEYVFEIAVEKRLLTSDDREALTGVNVTSLAPWDPMGALAK